MCSHRVFRGKRLHGCVSHCRMSRIEGNFWDCQQQHSWFCCTGNQIWHTARNFALNFRQWVVTSGNVNGICTNVSTSSWCQLMLELIFSYSFRTRLTCTLSVCSCWLAWGTNYWDYCRFSRIGLFFNCLNVFPDKKHLLSRQFTYGSR